MKDYDSKILESLYENVQTYTSANTSINKKKLPATFTSNHFDTQSGEINLDLGGGKFDNGTEYLKSNNITNLIVDPFNRSANFNNRNLAIAKENGVHSVTVNNVLNVIAEPDVRKSVIKTARSFLKTGKKAFFLIHSGKKNGIGRETLKNSWQENRKASSYIPEISPYFSDVKLVGNLIIAIA